MSPPYNVFECVTWARSLAMEMMESPSPIRESNDVNQTDLHSLKSGDDGYQEAGAEDDEQNHLAYPVAPPGQGCTT